MKSTTPSQFSKAESFKKLHESSEIFVIPNPWDAASAKMLTAIGYKALATTSAGMAYTYGKTDGRVTRTESLENARMIVAATHLPVAADLENGFGDDPETCAETILLAAEVGLVGGSIEDATGKSDNPIYDFELSVARIKAAVAAARSLPFHFTLTARAENYLHGRNDLKDTINRLVAYAQAGADVLFAPGITAKEEIKAIINAVTPLPVNVLWAFPNQSLSVNELASLGAKRISTGSSLARAAYGAFYNAAKEIHEQGTFGYVNEAIPYLEMNALLIR